MAEQREFALRGLTLAAETHGPEDGLPVLALHGWLDNAGSFALLAPRLAGCRVVALDLAGHGQSGWRSADAGYELTSDVRDVLDVGDALGWRRFTLLGHSRGAAIATLFAAAFPERVANLVLIEGGLPLVDAAADAPATLAKSVRDARALLDRSGRVFADRAAAIDERTRGFTKLGHAAAEILARRSLREVPGGHRWHADQRLKGASALRFTAEQVHAFVAAVRAPVLVVLAEQSPFLDSTLYREMLPRFANGEVVRLAGGHHLHLEGAEDEIARRIREFLGLP